jgi:hypothetical protein
MQAQLAYVIRPNGDVPFDTLEDGSEHPHKAALLGHLVATGHTLDVNPDTGHHRIVSGPLKPASDHG